MSWKTPRKTVTAVVAASIGVLAVPALAAPAIDTVLLQGYDPDNAHLLFGVTELDSGCALAAGEYTYQVGEDGTVTVSNGDDDEADAAGAEDGDGSGDCVLTAVDVTGPNGQVNHGQVVSSFVQALKALGFQGNGCLVRVIAQTDYGKGDQQITVPEAGAAEGAPELLDDTTELDPMVALAETSTACGGGQPDRDAGELDDRGKPEDRGKSEDRGKPEGTGRPDHAGKPDDAGKSEDRGNNGNGNGGGKP
jgi:hypothetical protein